MSLLSWYGLDPLSTLDISSAPSGSDPHRWELLVQLAGLASPMPSVSCAGSTRSSPSTSPACTPTHTRSCPSTRSCRSPAWNKRWQCWLTRGRLAPAWCRRGWWGGCRGRRGVGWLACSPSRNTLVAELRGILIPPETPLVEGPEGMLGSPLAGPGGSP